MYHYVYAVTNLLDRKVYVGKHSTDDLDDDYMGSGKLLFRAIAKYDLENFRKDILGFFDSEIDALDVERRLVTEEFVSRNDTYNLIPGGKGGWHHTNIENDRNRSNKQKAAQITWKKIRSNTDMLRRRHETSSNALRKNNELGLCGSAGGLNSSGFTGMQHTSFSKEKMSKAASERTGERNSQFGTVWIHHEDFDSPRKVKLDDFCDWSEQGWKRGRKKNN